MQKHPEYDFLVPAGIQARLVGPVAAIPADNLGWEIDELWLWTRVLENMIEEVGENNAFRLTEEPKRVVFLMPAPLFFAWVEHTGGEVTTAESGRLKWDAGDQIRFAPQTEDEAAGFDEPSLIAFAVMKDESTHEHGFVGPVAKLVEEWMKEKLGVELQPMPVPAPPAAQPVKAFGLPMQNPGQVA
jgi:hypothetical protein